MIGTIFKPEHDILVEKYKYDDRYLNYFSSKVIYENEGLNEQDFFDLCLKEFGKTFSKVAVKNFLKTNFRYDKKTKKYYVSLNQESLFGDLFKVLSSFYYYGNKEIDFIINSLNDSFKDSNKNLNNLISLFLAIDNLDVPKDIEYNKMVIYDIISNFNNLSNQIDDLFNNKSINKSISLIIKNEKLISLFNKNSIDAISDLRKLSNEELLALFSGDVKDLKRKIDVISNKNPYSFIGNLIDNYIKKCCEKDQRYIVFKYKYGIACKPLTLYEVGKLCGYTGEMVRQVCQKIEGNLNENKDDILFELNYLFDILNEKYPIYYSKSDLKGFFHNDEEIDELATLCNILDLKIHYDKDHEIFFNTDKEGIINEEIQKIGDAISIENFQKLTDFGKKVVINNYKLDTYDHNLYIREDSSYISILLKIIDENFPDGYKTGSDDEFNNLKEKFKEKYGVECEKTKAGLGESLKRYNYCYIDRGKVKNRNLVNELSDDLVIDINNYLAEKGGNVYYSSIFNDFKDRLLLLGINNRFFLKGVLDDKLLEDFDCQRDYIRVVEGFANPFEQIRNEIDNQTGVIYINELREKYNGVQDYVFLNYISKIDGVIWLKYKEEFILLRNIAISDSTVELIDKDIQYLFESMNENVIHVSKLYSRIKIMHPEILNELPLIRNSFALFSLVNTLFNDKYYFRRPYISNDENAQLTRNSILNEFVYTQQKITPNVVNQYLSKMNFGYLNDYLALLIDISDTFVQINKDTAYRKELLNIDEISLEKINYELDNYINVNGLLDTREYNNYIKLPNLKVCWNKYLLVGIIRSYFNDDYSIEYTDRTYRATDFIIRKIR